MGERFLTQCRSCGGTTLTPAFTLGTDNAWLFCGDPSGEEGCGLLQRATIGAENLASPIEPLSWAEEHRLKSVVSSAMEMISTRDGKALDIGCGNGTLLSAYPRWITPMGVDPRLESTGAADWGVGIAQRFVSDAAQQVLQEVVGDGFEVITAVGSLELEEAPIEFLQRVKDLLAHDGIVIIETPYAALSLTRTLTSAFHRESQAVYSLANLEALSAKVGLRIVRGNMTEMYGGSLRLFLTHEDYFGHDYMPWFDGLARLWDEEAALALHGRQAYNAYKMRLDRRTQDIMAFKADLLRHQEHAYVIGTGPRMISALHAAGLDYDVISAHIGATYRGGFPEVITEEMAFNTPPDVLIAPSWRRRETLEAWHDHIMEGTRVAFLEPDLLIVDEMNYGTELGRALAVTDGPGSVETLRAALSAMRGPHLKVVPQSTAS